MRRGAARSNFNRLAWVAAGLALWLAHGPVLAQTVPRGIVSVVTGNHTCALTTEDTVKCWGANFFGQLGDNSTTERLTPVDVISGPSLPVLSGVSAISAGLSHTCALVSGGVKCWGANSFGQLGDGSVTQRLTPVDVVGLTSGVAAIAAGSSHTCARTVLGGVKCWGNNAAGKLGNNSLLLADSPVPVDVITLPTLAVLSGVVAVAAGGEQTCAILSGGGMKCWGQNSHGELGINIAPVLQISRTPLDVVGLAGDVAAISLGAQHTCALLASGGLQCWGSNAQGQVGDNANVNRLVPVDVLGLTAGVAVIEAGIIHTCALTTTGGAKCWGRNGSGQLGDNSTSDSAVAVDVVSLTAGARAISAGADHTCAVTASYGVKCWGGNGNGQLGDNTKIPRLTPVDVLVPPPITLSGVKSRKTHAAAGSFDLPIDTTQLVSGAVTVEPRGIGTGYLVVFQFSSPIATPGAPSAVDGAGAPLAIAATTFFGNDVTVALATVPENSRATITLTGVNGVLNTSASLGFLVGDVDNTRSVNSSDISGVKARSGQTTDATNFQFDLNASGAINSSDISAVKARSGLVLPVPLPLFAACASPSECQSGVCVSVTGVAGDRCCASVPTNPVPRLANLTVFPGDTLNTCGLNAVKCCSGNFQTVPIGAGLIACRCI
jgi:alpha-tubulin suppressor-like RCC1 family protein